MGLSTITVAAQCPSLEREKLNSGQKLKKNLNGAKILRR